MTTVLGWRRFYGQPWVDNIEPGTAPAPCFLGTNCTLPWPPSIQATQQPEIRMDLTSQQAAQGDRSIPLVRSSCTPGTTLDAHWANSDQSCTWGQGELLASYYSCTSSSPPCATYTQSQSQPCMQIIDTRCPSLSVVMDAACDKPTSGAFTETETRIPC